MINSHLNHYASGLGSDDIDFHDIKMHQLSYSQPEIKSLKPNNTKSLNSVPGSSSNSNSTSNGVYVDMGKVLLEASKSGDSDKVQECVKNGAPFITDWVSLASSERGMLLTLLDPFSHFSWGHQRYILLQKTITSTHVPHSCDRGSARMPRRKWIERRYILQYLREIMKFVSF